MIFYHAFQEFSTFLLFTKSKIQSKIHPMKVTIKEIRRLQDDITDKIDLLNDDPDADYEKLTELRSIHFNLSMLFLRYSMEKDTTVIELDENSEYRNVIEALKPRRKNIGTKQGNTDALVSQLTPLLPNVYSEMIPPFFTSSSYNGRL